MSQTLALFSLSIRIFNIAGVLKMVFINTTVIWKSIINNDCEKYLEKKVVVMYYMLLTVQSPGDTKENNGKSQLSIVHILVRFKTIIF